MDVTIRERILEEIRIKLEAMTENDHNIVWHKVARTPLDRTNKLLKNGISVLDGTEVVAGRASGMGIMDNNMTVILEFWLKNEYQEQASTYLNKVIGGLKKLVMNNRNWVDTDGVSLALNTEVLSNSLDIDGLRDTYVNGVVEIQVSYRHRWNDPTLII